MIMIIFFTDLDNTLIYSRRHETGSQKTCVELYRGREVSFMTNRTMALLKEISAHLMVVPVTTRTLEQYRRIRTGFREASFALVCNGGILLENGVEDRHWYAASLEMIAESREQMKKAEALMEKDRYRTLEVRNINDLFLFTKSSRPEESVSELAGYLDSALVRIFSNGQKVYVLPVGLDKGTAVRRLAARLGPDLTIAAGDSAFDIPMLKSVDHAFAPERLAEHPVESGRMITIRDGEIFSERVLEEIRQRFL